MTLARVDHAELARRAQLTADAAQSESTRRAYAADWRDFDAWCRAHALEPGPPCPGEVVAIYLNELHLLGRAYATLQRKLAAIAHVTELAGGASPYESPALRQVMKGIRRTRAVAGRRPAAKAPLVLEQLRSVAGAAERYLVGRRDRALLVVGFAGAFRRSELAALELGDLEKRPEGYVVTVRRSKTDQEGRGQQKGLPYGSDPATCPVRTLDAWLSAAEITEGRVFRSIAWHGAIGASLSPRAIAQIVKRHCELAGLEPSKYGAHSLRSGFVTTAARAGKSTRSIMDQTGHRTVAIVFGYVKSAALFEENAAMGIGL